MRPKYDVVAVRLGSGGIQQRVKERRGAGLPVSERGCVEVSSKAVAPAEAAVQLAAAFYHEQRICNRRRNGA